MGNIDEQPQSRFHTSPPTCSAPGRPPWTRSSRRGASPSSAPPRRPGSVGRTILRNLVGNPFGGTVFPVNPKRPSVLGIKAYPSIADVPDRVDLAVIVTPAPTVPGLIGECVEAGVRGAIIISAGFKETGPGGGRAGAPGPGAGAARPDAGHRPELPRRDEPADRPERHLRRRAWPGPATSASSARAARSAPPSSTGACASNVGFSAFVSVGSMLDVGWGDLIDYLGDDPHTSSIVIYMESIGDARSFLSAAREVALTKPIIVIKAGRTEAAAQGGGLAHRRADRQRRGARRRLPPLRRAAGRHASPSCSTWPRCSPSSRGPRGPRLTIVTNAGGPGVLATDALIGGGGELAAAGGRDARRRSNAFLPAALEPRQPDRRPGRRRPRPLRQGARGRRRRTRTATACWSILTPQAMTDPTQTAEQLQAATPGSRASRSWPAGWAGPTSRPARRSSTRPASRPSPTPTPPPAPSTPCGATADNLRALYETPTLPAATDQDEPGRDRAAALIAGGPGRGPDAADRGGIEAAARRSTASRPSPPASPATRGRPSQPPTRSATRSCSSSTPRRSRTRPTSAACS